MPPSQLARGDVVGIEESPDPEFAAGNADDGHVFHDHWHRRGAEPLGVVGNCPFPPDLAGQAVEGDQLRIQRRHQDEVAGDGGTAVHLPAAQTQVIRLLMVVAPVDIAGGRVEREYPV